MLGTLSVPRDLRVLIAPFLMATLTFGCATAAPPPDTEPDPQPAAERPEDTVVPEVRSEEPAADLAERERLEAEISALEDTVAALQLRLLESEAQAATLQGALNAAIREAVRSKAKLQSVESRAEAASTMAEAEIALTDRLESAGRSARTTQAAELLEMSAREFESENYGGALYLATQAKDMVSDVPGRMSSSDPVRRPDETLFDVSLPLRVVRSSNVREGPGTSFKILFVLEAGAEVMGHAYEAQWVRISLADGRAGWIYSTLVESHGQGSP